MSLVSNFSINLLWIYFIDIKAGFNYNYDDTGDNNLGLNNNFNIKRKNIITDGVD